MSQAAPSPPVLLKACLNGGRTRDEHGAVPQTAAELAADARRAVDAGARAVHVHPRGVYGAETLGPGPCGEAVAAIREACPGIPVGLSTGEWIEPALDRRLSLIAAWDPPPDFASVNVSDEGAFAVARALLSSGIGVEAGLASIHDARVLVVSGIAGRCTRILVEPREEDAGDAVATARAIEEELLRAGIDRPQLHHGLGPATWAVIEAALERGHDVRAGLEDTLVMPDGSPAPGNAELVAAAVEMARRHARAAEGG